MENENKKDGAGEPGEAPVIDPERTRRRSSLARHTNANTSNRKASFFIGDVEGHRRTSVKIVGPDYQEIPTDEIIVPPDGGYGYVIVLAAFFSNVVVDGVVFSFGALKDGIQNDKNLKEPLDPSIVAWIGSLLTGFYLLTGPFVSAIANKFGFRTVAILGSLIACGGFTMSWFLNPTNEPPNIPVLVCLYGIIGGIGFSCIYVPAVIAVGFYFEKKRALATGIAICGSGIGNFIFPHLISRLIPLYGWQWTILIMGLMVLTCGLLGILYRPLTPRKMSTKRLSFLMPRGTPEGTPLLMRIKRARDMIKWDSMGSFSSNHGGSESDIQKGNEDPPTGLYKQARKHSTVSLKRGSNRMSLSGAGGMQSKRAPVPTMLTTTGEPPSFPQAAGVLVNVPNKAISLKAKSFVGLPDLHETEEEHGSDDAGSRENSAGLKLATQNKSEATVMDFGNRKALSVTYRIGNSMLIVDEITNSRIIRVSSRVTLNRPLYRDDLFYSGSLLRIPDYANNVMTSTEWTAAVTRALGNNDDEDVESPKSTSCLGSCDMLKKMFDVSLLVSPTFIVFAISGMFTMLGMFAPFVFLMDQAHKVIKVDGKEPSKELLSPLISLIGIANTIGRILAGWIADRPFVNALILNNGAVTIMGISTLMIPLLSDLAQFMLYSCVFGISMACFASLRSILVVELLGLSKLTNAFGLLLLFQGIASIVATPLSGMLSVGGDFSISFYVAGGFMLLSAVMCYPLNRLNQWEKGRKRSKSISRRSS